MPEGVMPQSEFPGFGKELPPVSACDWEGLHIELRGWQAKMAEADFRQNPELEASTRQTLQLLPEELLEKGLFIFDGAKPRIVFLTGFYGRNSGNRMQA